MKIFKEKEEDINKREGSNSEGYTGQGSRMIEEDMKVQGGVADVDHSSQGRNIKI